MGIYAKLERLKDCPAPAGTSTPRIQHATEDGYTLAYGTTVPVDATEGYAPSCLFLDTDSGVVYLNTGTKTSSAFKAIATVSNLETLLGSVDLDELTMSGVTYTLPEADGSNGQQLTTNGSGTLTWAAAAGTFTGGNIASDITMNGDGVDILSDTTTAHSTGIQGYTDGGARKDALRVTNGATVGVVLGAADVSLQIASTGLDVSAAGAVSGVTTLSASGAVTAASADITGAAGLTLENDATITNSTDSEITFTDGGEDLTLDMDSASNTIGLKSSTGVTGIAFGDVDDLSGIGSISFDAAASTVTLASTGDAQDLTIRVTGATNSSLVLSSAGTEADALQVLATAGGIDITASSSEDIDVSGTGGINIISSENAAAAVTVNASTGASSTVVLSCTSGTGEGAVTITGTAGGVDIDAAAAKNVDIAGGQVLIASKDNAASAIALTANVGASETIVVTNTQGTGAGAVTLTSTAGGVDVDAAAAKDVDIAGGQVLISSKDNAASAIALTANVGTSETIVVTNTQGTGNGAVTLTATAGGVDIDAAATKPVDIAGGNVAISSKTAGATAITLTTNQGAAEKIVVTNTQGTDEAAITLTATAGGIDMDAAAAKNIDIAGGQVAISSKDNAASAIALTANVGSSETIVVTNTQGTDAAAIALTASAGGITATVATGKAITLAGTTNFKHGSDIASPAGGELTLGDGMYFDITGNNNITSIAAASSTDGRLVILRFEGTPTFTDGNNLKLAGNFVATADDTITLICDGTDWYEIARSAN